MSWVVLVVALVVEVSQLIGLAGDAPFTLPGPVNLAIALAALAAALERALRFKSNRRLG